MDQKHLRALHLLVVLPVIGEIQPWQFGLKGIVQGTVKVGERDYTVSFEVLVVVHGLIDQ